MQSQRTRYFIDALILLFLAAALAIELTGGFYSEPLGIRVSARRPDRPLFAALILALIRWRLSPSGEFFGRPIDWYRHIWRRLFDRAADEVTERPRSRLYDLAACGALVAIAALMLREQLRQLTGVPDLGDPLFSMWRMGWVFHQLQGDPRGLFDANIFHPMPLTFTLSDSMLLPSLIAAPLFAAGMHPVLIYTVLLLATFPINGIATYFLLRHLLRSSSAAFCGALFYMSHPYHFEHYSHFELQMTMWMPLAMLALLRFVEHRRLRDGLASAFLLAAQLYSSMYYGVYFPIYAGAVIAVLMVARGWAWRPLLGRGAASAVVALALAAPLARPYVAAQAIKGDRDTAAVEYYSADFSDFLRPTPRLAVHGGRWLEDSHPERALFPGVTPVLLAIVGLAPPVGPVRAAFAVGLALSYDLTRGLKGTIYPTLYRTFPPIRGIRVPARFSVILGISLAVLAAFGVRRILSRWQGRLTRHLALAGIVALMAIDLSPRLELRPVWPDIPRIYQELQGRQDVVLAEFPFIQTADPLTTSEIPFMYFSLWHWHQMINGYSGFVSDPHLALIELSKDFPDPASIAALRTRGVTHVTVNCRLMKGDCKSVLDRIDARPEFKLIRIAHWTTFPTRLYEFVR